MLMLLINDRPVNDYYLVESKSEDLKRLDDSLTSEEYGFAMKKGNTELAEKINAALKTIKENGDYVKFLLKNGLVQNLLNNRFII